MPYIVKEIFYSLQGEGAWTGRPAVFCRFTGCNLWSGRQEDRLEAICPFCDTDFLGWDGPGGGRYQQATSLATAVAEYWPSDPQSSLGRPYVICTGGEPLLQLDESLVRAFQQQGFQVGVETNGTLPPPAGLDWLCVSPKINAPLLVTQGNELKLVYPQTGLDPADYQALAFQHFFLQPRDDGQGGDHIQAAVAYCLAHPQWRLSLQTHKVLGIP